MQGAGVVIRRRRTRCLQPETLAELAQGRMPSEELNHIRQHLPNCSRCRDTIAANMRHRAGAHRGASSVEPPLLVAADSSQVKLFRSLALGLSLLALGSSVTCWYLDPGLAAGRPGLGAPPGSGHLQGVMGSPP